MKNWQPTQEIHLLWNGGFSSTYRMIQLSRHDINIVPHYINTHSTRSFYELKAIQILIEEIRQHPQTKSIISPLIVCKSKDILPDITITGSWRWLNIRTRIDRVYEQMSRYIKHAGEETKIELGLASDPEHKAFKYIRVFACGHIYGEREMQHLLIDPQKGFKEFTDVFRYFRFPLPLFGMTKQEIFQGYKELGFEHLLPHIWLCHSPLKGIPCGRCNGCKQIINANLNIKLPKITLTMNKLSNAGKYKLHYKTKKNLNYLPGF